MKSCYILFEITDTKDEARRREREIEGSARFLYVGNVKLRDR